LHDCALRFESGFAAYRLSAGIAGVFNASFLWIALGMTSRCAGRLSD
jgi:hypothetical protein